MAFDREIAALTVFCEASSATPEERLAVMWVIRNRYYDMRHRFGRTVAEVCLARYQFSEWLDDRGDNSNLLRGARASDNDAVMVQCVAAYDVVISAPSGDDLTGSATHYHDKTIAPPAWAAAPAELALETEHFRFYRNVP